MIILNEKDHPFVGRFLPMVEWKEVRLSCGIIARFRVYSAATGYVLQCTIPGVCWVAVKDPFDTAHDALEQRFEVLKALGYEPEQGAA